jgi:hypothetical protein
MAFITHCWKKTRLLERQVGSNLRAWLCALLLLPLGGLHAHAQTSVDWQDFKLERTENVLFLSANLVFEVPKVLEDAMYKGVSLYFVTQADVMRDRWYFYDKVVAHVERNSRLSYMPLTRRWRVTTSPEPFTASGTGVTMGQTFETLDEALSSIQHVSQWRLANLSDLDTEAKNYIEFKFRLDLAQLPRPLQIGAATQNDWNLSFSKSVRLNLESAR